MSFLNGIAGTVLGGLFRGSGGSVVLGGLGGRFLSDKAHISSFKCLQSL